MAGPPEQRIAIRLGAVSASKPNKKSPLATPNIAPGKRLLSRFHPVDDGDSDGDTEDAENSQPVIISQLGASGTKHVDEARTRRDRLASKGRAKVHQTIHSPAQTHQHESHVQVKDLNTDSEEKPPKYGLTVAKRPRQEQREAEEEDEDVPSIPNTGDQPAFEALTVTDTSRPRYPHRTEDEAYRDAAASAPEPDQVETYDEIPVEGFGAYLLRKQGWDGKMRGPKAKKVVIRPNGLGLGAKKLEAEEDLGGWDQKGKGKSAKRPRLDEYHRTKDKERSRHEARYRESYRNERDRERDRRHDSERDHDRNRDRDPGWNSNRHRERNQQK